ncbi:hypothetical protein SAY87_025671 [Trapa incisa]|uniref:Uncharacterized protein n=1 Tax=Trapa incisa TaxID=236973 RepID=A0AAN7JJ99_9MYRT|nr:hypothetical protein SAY87_025671 [Trapa incisa]
MADLQLLTSYSAPLVLMITRNITSHIASQKNIITYTACIQMCACRFTSAVAFFLLLTAAAMNERHSEDNSNFKNYYCYIVKPGVFAAGAALSLVSVILGMLYYLIFTSQQESDAADSGLPEPHIQRRRDPVFVHEDTYMRRQSA